jgi:hypothetical protein
MGRKKHSFTRAFAYILLSSEEITSYEFRVIVAEPAAHGLYVIRPLVMSEVRPLETLL